jgi:hypothetical protein
MQSTDALKTTRMRRERLMRYTNPFVRPFEWAKDAWTLWAAYDMGSFPALPKGLTKPQFGEFVRNFVAAKSSVLVIEEDHKYFREKRGPVALVSVDTYAGGWKMEPQIDFFYWATKRQRLAAVVSFLQMVRYSKEIGVCVVRVGDKDVKFCEHLYKYDLLRPIGKLPNARPDGVENIFYVKGRKSVKAPGVALERKAA